MNALIFIETPPFERLRGEYLGDDHYRLLQCWLMINPEAGDMIRGSNGIRELRWGIDDGGKRGVLRVVYYYLDAKPRICLLTLCHKSVVSDLSDAEMHVLRQLVKQIGEN